MTWLKVDYKGNPIKNNSGWHIPNYICGDYKIINDCGRYRLTKNGQEIGTFRTLKAAKAEAEK